MAKFLDYHATVKMTKFVHDDKPWKMADKFGKWDISFISEIPTTELNSLKIVAERIFNLPHLVDLCNAKMAKLSEGRNPEEIAKILDIPMETDPDELKQTESEREWVVSRFVEGKGNKETKKVEKREVKKKDKRGPGRL
jgi:hypothetical protein